MPIRTRQALIGDVAALAPLFDAYRQFYEQPSDLALAQRFLADRFEHAESIIFIAEDETGAVGFTQLYPSFSSTHCARVLVLNDLFVRPESRGQGVGSRLLVAAAEYGKATGAVYLSLQTARTNTIAQALYIAKGWVLDEVYLTYELPLD